MKIVMGFLIKYKNYFIVVLFALIALLPLFHQGLIPTHDGEYHVVRFSQFYKVLSEGTLYPRWAPDFNNGYGIPLFNYQYPLPNYMSSLFHFFGVSFIDSFKLNLIFATITSAVFMYLWAKSYWGSLGGVVSSIFYTYSPYRFVDIYVRGSVGEVWALAFAPAVLWCLNSYSKTKKKKFVILGGIFLALLVYSHNILALLFCIFTSAYMLYLFFVSYEEKSKLMKGFIAIVLLGFGLSAPFFLPALFETKYVTGLQVFDISKNFPELYQLIFPSWGSGFSDGISSNSMSYQIGIMNLIVIVLVLISLIKSFIKKRKNKSIKAFMLCAFFTSVFFMLSFSEFIWRFVPLLSYFQFPWRILSLVILISSFLAGSLFVRISKKALFLSSVLIIILVLSTINYTRPAYYLIRNDEYYLTRSNFIDGTNSPGNVFNTKWLNFIPSKKPLIRIVSGDVLAKLLVNKSTIKIFEFNSRNNSTIIFSIAYFPGWKAKLNGKNLNIQNRNGLISINIPKGKSIVELKFSDTTVRTFSTIIFFLSFIILPFLIVVLI